MQPKIPSQAPKFQGRHLLPGILQIINVSGQSYLFTYIYLLFNNYLTII